MQHPGQNHSANIIVNVSTREFDNRRYHPLTYKRVLYRLLGLPNTA